MKKILCIAIVMVGFLTMTNVHAMTESDLLAKIKSSYNINGENVKLDSSYVTLAERYFDENDLSESDMNYISNKIDAVVNIMQNDSTADISKLSTTAKNEVKQIATDITANTAVKVVVTKDGFTVYNTDGSEFSEIEKTAIKYTDNSLINLIALAGITCGGIVLVSRIKKRNA